MKFQAENFYHLYNRGNNGLHIFFEEDNYEFFLKKVIVELEGYCSIISYCLMPNHYHFLIYTGFASRQTTQSGQTTLDKKMKKLPRKIGTIQSSYTRAINKRFELTGSLFQQKARALNLSDSKVNYLPETCFHYIHQNPLKAKLINRMEEWPYSSFAEYLNKTKRVCNHELAYKLLDIDFTNFRNESRGVMNDELALLIE